MVFLIGCRIMTLPVLWEMVMALVPRFEPNSHCKHAKQWVDNTNNWCHDLIALSAVWRTKWWHTRQFIFLLDIAEANAAYLRGDTRNKKETPQLDFYCTLAEKMPIKNIDNDGWTVVQFGWHITSGSLEMWKWTMYLRRCKGSISLGWKTWRLGTCQKWVPNNILLKSWIPWLVQDLLLTQIESQHIYLEYYNDQHALIHSTI